jgi:glutamate racemase
MIGIFDSGIGGLTVVNALRQRLSDYDLIYFGDTACAPYGSKSAETVLQNVLNKSETLLKCGAELIIVACHTASSVATEHIRQRFGVPVFECISPAVKFSLQITLQSRLGIIGTRTTISSGAYARKIRELNPAAKVYSVACPLLIPLAEEGWFKKPITSMIVKKYLYPLKVKQIDTLILGCNYFPLFKRIIQAKIGRRVHLVDPSLTMVDSLAQYLQEHAVIRGQMARNQRLRLMVSDLTDQVEKAAQIILKQKVPMEQITS